MAGRAAFAIGLSLLLGCPKSSCPSGSEDVCESEADGGFDAARPTCEPCEDGTYCDEGSLTCVECLSSEHCADEAPACDPVGHSCVECINDGYCDGENRACNRDTHSCVECWEENLTACTFVGEECDVATGQCEECVTDGHCDDPGAAHCSDNACVPCQESAHCSGVDEGDRDLEICNAGVCVECTALEDGACEDGTVCDESTGRCVECVDDSHCTDASAAKCDTATHRCVACDSNAQCSDVVVESTDLPVCLSGECVQCTSGAAAECGSNPCTTSNVCSEFGTAVAACGACDTDANCAADHFCIRMEYQSDPYPDEDNDGVADHGFCLKTTATACAGPYLHTIAGRTSMSGVAGNAYCGIAEGLTTCDAVVDLLGSCAGGMDNECGDGAGGLCRTINSIANRCTIPCTSTSDCPPAGDASTCDNSDSGVNFCGGA